MYHEKKKSLELMLIRIAFEPEICRRLHLLKT
jgi:hypothetical protein